MVPTFGEFTDEILVDLLPGFRNVKHREQWERTLRTHGASLRTLRVDEIETDDVLAVLRPIWSAKNETASRLQGRIARILGAAKAKGFRPHEAVNPAAWEDHLEHFLPKRRRLQKGHYASISWREMPDFWAGLARRGGSTTVEALRFTILTAARTGETIGATWREIDLEAGVWTVPKERMKMGVAHAVPLSAAAVTLLNRLRASQEAKGAVFKTSFVFPGLWSGRHLSNMAMLGLLQKEIGRSETVHGFRSSFRDWAGDATSFPRELAEQALAHAIGDKAEQAYRRGTALEKRRPLMEAWAAFWRGRKMPLPAQTGMGT